MELQQLIVDAPSLTDHSENQLVAKSSNIKQELIEHAVKWSTVGSGLLGDRSSAVFYCRSRAGTGMIGRSYPSSLDRQGNRLMRTHWVLVSSNQMKCFYNNAVLIIRILNSSGQWVLQTSSLVPVLSELKISDCPINTFAYPDQEQEVGAVKRAVGVHGQVAITDAIRPLDFMGQVLRAHSFKERAKLSFALDRRVAGDTPFQINAFSQSDIRLEHDLSQQSIFAVRLRSVVRS